MKQTLFDKIWNLHVVAQRSDGRDLLYIDRHVVHDLHAPHAFNKLGATSRTVRRPDLTICVQDHTVPTVAGMPLASPYMAATTAGAKRYGISVIDASATAHGISHVISPELGIALPGLTLACPDSHASTVGALGCLAFGCGTSDLGHILVTQVIALNKPGQMRVTFSGKLSLGLGAKDLALHLIRNVGVSTGRGHVVEYAGPVIREMGVEARMTLCNMTIEWGARSCLIAPDDRTFAYCKERPGAPSGDDWNATVAWWRSLPTDLDATFDREMEFNCTGLGPQVTWGTDPAQTVSVNEPIPHPASSDRQAVRALAYMGLEPGALLAGMPIDRVFIGSCSNSRLSDLRDAAEVVHGRKVAPGVTAVVVPGSSTVKRLAESEGLDRIFEEAGFIWRNSGCSMCVGANGDIAQPGERCVSTTNRNFENRQGRGVRTHLVSPLMAAAAAVTGRIVDVRELLTTEV